MSLKKNILRVGAVVLIVAIGIVAISPAGKAIRTLLPAFLQKDVSGTEEFKGNVAERLKAMKTAADLYHQSEDAFPKAETWTDDLLARLQTQNLKPGEAEKKLKRPDLETSADQYGFAINKAVAGKYKGDIKDPKTILIFESKETKKNASGDPKTDGKEGGQGITISGEVVKL